MATEIEIKDRLALFQRFIDAYKHNFITTDNFHDVEIESATDLNIVYWETVDLYVKKYMERKSEGRINLYKVISAIEFSIMKLLPFRLPMCEDGPRKDALINFNAKFALFCSIALLKDWPHDDWSKSDYDSFLLVFDESLSKLEIVIKKDHLTWLNKLNVEVPYPPIFIGAQFWKMVSLYIEQTAGIKHRF